MDADEKPKLVEIDIVRSDEPWGEIMLADGAKIKFRQVIMKVSRADGQVGPDSGPVYRLEGQLVTHVTPSG